MPASKPPVTAEEAKIYQYCARAWKDPTFKWETIKISKPPSDGFKDRLHALAKDRRVLILFKKSKEQHWIFATRDAPS